MKFLIDFFPILLFFIGYKWFGIYYATAIAILASMLQVIIHRVKHRCYEKMHLISFAMIFVFGGATLFFHNPWFIKWKPTGVYWASALALLVSSWINKKPIIQRMMENSVLLSQKIWYGLTYAWALFFLIMGAVNIYVAYFYSTDTWVNFKLFGCTGLTLLFVLAQAYYIKEHLLEKDLEK